MKTTALLGFLTLSFGFQSAPAFSEAFSEKGGDNSQGQSSGAAAAVDRSGNSEALTFHEWEAQNKKVSRIAKWGMLIGVGGTLAAGVLFGSEAVWAPVCLSIAVSGYGCYCAFKNKAKTPPPPL